VKIPVPTITPFLYNEQDKTLEPKELDAFNRISLTLSTAVRPASNDEYKDYNI
jgi:hypothetical protein